MKRDDPNARSPRGVTPPAVVRARRARAFTIVELLISVAIIAVLLSLLLPAMARARMAARSFRCQMSLRSVAFDFQLFADRELHGDRGNDADLGNDAFTAETFLNAQYGLLEFWAWGNLPSVRLPDANGRDPMRCPEVAGDITLLRNTPCTDGAITPPQRISYGFNFRLHRPVGVQAVLSGKIVEQPGVPLLWDVDGQAAASRGLVPVFSAPGLGSSGILANDLYWFPSFRHGGNLNVAFVDGHVATSASPLTEPGWNWGYQPE